MPPRPFKATNRYAQEQEFDQVADTLTNVSHYGSIEYKNASLA